MAKKETFFRKFLRKTLKVFIWFLLVSVIWVLAYRFINPPITLLMVIRKVSTEGKAPIKKNWVKLEDMSNHIKRAAIASEDDLFYQHYGFNFKAIQKAAENNMSGNKIKGGSTISQQTAKNVFLWPGRNWLRKGMEAYFTVLIELLWGKDRILEVYLNVIEMGKGIYGAEAASQHYFKKSVTGISRSQSALLVACFPNPIRWTPARPTPYIYRKQASILKRMRYVKSP